MKSLLFRPLLLLKLITELLTLTSEENVNVHLESARVIGLNPLLELHIVNLLMF